MDYGFSEKRSKKKDKFRNKKRHPYKKGGWQRTMKEQSFSSMDEKEGEER